MNETARCFRDFVSLALAHPEGPEVARAFNRTLQFELDDDDPFYMSVLDGEMSIVEGDSGLDWKYRDWERVTCVHTTGRVIREIIRGDRLVSEAFFDQEIGFAPRRMADRETSAEAIVAWFYTLIRLAHEQSRDASHRRYLAELGL